MSELEVIREFLRRGAFQLTENDARVLLSVIAWLDQQIESSRAPTKDTPNDGE